MPYYPKPGDDPKILVTDFAGSMTTGFFGYSPDVTPRANYTVAGKNAGLATPETPGTLGITSLVPNTAVKGAADVTMTVNGTGFIPGAIINFNGGDQATTFVSATALTTLVRVSAVTVAGPQAVYVRMQTGQRTAALNFTFT